MNLFKIKNYCVHKALILSVILSSVSFNINADGNGAKLITVIGSAMSAPFLLDNVGNEKQAKGLTRDYVEALLKRLNLEVEVLVLPKYRIKEYAKEGRIDLNCYTNQKWAGSEVGDVLWSNTIFTVKDLLISRDNGVKSISDAYGKTVGVVFSYKYPGDFENAVDKNLITKGHSPNEKAILTKLLAKRYDFAIVPHIQLDYFLKENPKVKINKNGFILNENEIRCWVKKSGPIKIDKLNKAIDEMKFNGELENIFNKYR